MLWTVANLMFLHIVSVTNGYTIQLIRQLSTFHGAEQYCRNHGGHLVSIHSDAENQAVYSLCLEAGQNCWIGYQKQGSSFVWTDGSSSSYSHFHPGEPDNWHGVEGCALMKVNNNYHGQWSDKECDASYDHSYFVCKYPVNGGHTDTPTQGGGHVVTHQPAATNSGKLGVQGTHFVYNGQRIFLSGVNKAWERYANDFGKNQYRNVRTQYQQVFQKLQQAGGNSIRVWIHIEGQSSPMFDSSGRVTGTDDGGTLISDMRTMLQDARRHNIFVFPTLWNGAVSSKFHYRLDGLIKDTVKLQSYLDHALIPLVKALKDEPALGGWDLMNEPEGEMKPDVYSSDPCHDTRSLHNSGAGWAGKLYTAQEIQRFLNWQADAIKRADPHALVTVGAWSGRANTDRLGFHNYYKDSCLIKSGGKQVGTLSFYQIHSYDWHGKFGNESPFVHSFGDFGLHKPVVIGEFREQSGGGMTINQLYDHAYFGGYAGGWAWSATGGNFPTMLKGIQHVKGYTDQSKGGRVVVSLQ